MVKLQNERINLTCIVTDYLDIVVDPVTGHDYQREEDPRLYVSEKTGRGPLGDNWREEYSAMVKQSGGGVAGGIGLMCAYKLCRVEFRYWGMQGKIERFIHDVGKFHCVRL
jgi:membrane-associated phosphatidylinositol transfer protein